MPAPPRGDSDVKAFFAAYTGNEGDNLAYCLDLATSRFERLVDEGDKNRHDAMFDVLCLVFKEAHAQAYPAKAGAKALLQKWHEATAGDPSHDRREFDRMMRDAVSRANADDPIKRREIMARSFGTDTRKEQIDMDEEVVWVDGKAYPYPGDDDEGSTDGGLPWEKFALTSAKELASKIDPVRWLVGGVWPEKSAGGVAGKKKTFKTWSMHSLGISVATQLNYLDEFPVFTPGPVLYLTGEGGQDEFKSRHRAIAKRYAISADDLNDLPFYAMFPIAPLDDSEFLGALKHHLDTVQPVLVCIDPLYAYHPKDVEVSNVYSRGPMLAKVREIIEPYAALIIGDHINKSADDSRLDLDDIGFSGMSQWVDSWSLQRHREKFQTFGADSFAKLEVEYGTRRAGSMRYDVDWHLTRDMSDPHVIVWDTCDWVVKKPNPVASAKLNVLINEGEAIRALQDYVDRNPTTNKTNATNKLPEAFSGLSRDDWRDLWDKAIREEYLVSVKIREERPYRDSTRLYEIVRFKRGREVGTGGQR